MASSTAGRTCRLSARSSSTPNAASVGNSARKPLTRRSTSVGGAHSESIHAANTGVRSGPRVSTSVVRISGRRVVQWSGMPSPHTWSSVLTVA
ncbi:hypothetical protein [Actinokineospora sp.]|uniref:hypothetical protein n=1 Tax=Actinokineospora sp. TaxID=1872133 RepID=UPI003D6A1128